RIAPVQVIERSGTTAPLDRVQRPTEKSQRLLRTPDAIERVNCERRVTQPRIAIIPVALAAYDLRQRRGRRRHERATLKVIEQLERQRRAAHYLFPSPFLPDARGPAPPCVARRDQRVLRRQRLIPAADGAAPAQCQMQTVAFSEFYHTTQPFQREKRRKLQIEMRVRWAT